MTVLIESIIENVQTEGPIITHQFVTHIEEEASNVSYTIINNIVTIDPGSNASSYERESEGQQDCYSNCF